MAVRAGAALTRVVLALLAVLVAATVLAPAATAHPLGNFTVNSYSGLRVQPHAVAVRVVVDSAEIPTIQQFPDADRPGGVTPQEAAAYAQRACARLLPGLELTVGGSRQPLTVRSSDLRLPPGQAGLRTMRLTCEVRTARPLTTTGQELEYVDQNSLERTGWREITATGVGVDLVDSDVATRSVSGELTDYPADLLSSPLDQRSASMRVLPGTGTPADRSGAGASAAGSGAARVDRLTAAFTNLVASRDLGWGFAAIALLLSIGLGALHAFAPGHGKTLMAAYLLGRRSSLRQVAIIGLTVTATHTAGVLVLGILFSALALASPARIYTWLGLASGLLLVGIGVTLLRQALRRGSTATVTQRAAVLVGAASGGHDHHHHHADDHTHDHPHGDDHAHDHGHAHSHGWGGTHTHPPPATGARSLVAVGFAGGMVPSPSALVVLLGGIALGRAWFGVLLVLAYGVGMALALIGTGLALAHARDRVQRWAERRQASDRNSLLLRAVRVLPAMAAALVIVVGVGLVLRTLGTW
ncbi:MAG: High-affinity nickel-transporter [Actinomycetota bacterium]|nr:High-affinity nickel-transporter [Actinomycetota bacterium]